MRFVLYGGLGNLLIQIAASRKIAEKYGCPIRYYESFVYSRLQIEQIGFNIIKQFYGVNPKSGVQAFVNEFEFKVLNRLYPELASYEFDAKSNKLPFITKGYYQSSEFWSNGGMEILEYLDLSPLVKPVTAKDIVIHLRGGDYLLKENADKFSTLNCSLAHDFINHCRNDSCNPHLPVTVVTDDPIFAHKWLGSLRADIISTDDIINDFSILATAKYLLTSESTFSILAGLHSFSLGGKVYTPKTLGSRLKFDFFKLPWDLI